MGINVVVEDERGTRIASLEDPTNILHRVLLQADDDGFHCLNRIDWYGDTTFNRLQIPDVRRELSRLNGLTAGEQDRTFIKQIDSLAVIAESEPHLYLKFYGD